MRGGVGTGVLRTIGAGIGTGLGFGGGGLPAYLLAQGATEGAIAARNSVARRVGQKASRADMAAEAIEAYKRSQVDRGLLAPYLPQYMLPYIQE